MFYEAQGKIEKAEEFYHDIIKEQPTNQIIAKRLVSNVLELARPTSLNQPAVCGC
jgi:hypothetical protein